MATRKFCKDCDAAFRVSASELKRLTEHGLCEPVRCPPCRRGRRLHKLRNVGRTLEELTAILQRGDVAGASVFVARWKDALAREADRGSAQQEQEGGAHGVRRTA